MDCSPEYRRGNCACVSPVRGCHRVSSSYLVPVPHVPSLVPGMVASTLRIDPRVGKVLRARRRAEHLSLHHVALRMGWKQGEGEVSEIERGLRDPQWSTFERLILHGLKWSWIGFALALDAERDMQTVTGYTPDEVVHAPVR